MPKLKVKLHNPLPIPLDVQFDCAPGELVALVGPSGSGKTSVLRAVAGLLPAHRLQGTVHVGHHTWFDSISATNLPPQARRAGLVFQSYALFPHLSAIENVAVGAGSARASGTNDADLPALFARLGLAGLEHRKPTQLSGGQQQRVALARALVRVGNHATAVGENGVLLLDEPFSAVDAPTRQTLYRELAALRQHVLTPMVLVTHDLQEARRLADRIVILDAGRTLQCGTPEEVFCRPRNARVAQLVGIQNLYAGTFLRDEPGRGYLLWGSAAHGSAGLRLRVVDKGRIEHGAAVHWVLSGESVTVMAQAAAPASQGAKSTENALDCELRQVLELGETSLCTLHPKAQPDQRLELTLSTSHLRGMGAVVGCQLHVVIGPQAIHIMPVRA